MTTPTEKDKAIKPVHINEDIWFYPTEKHLEFVVYVGNKPTQFKITKNKLKKYV